MLLRRGEERERVDWLPMSAGVVLLLLLVPPPDAAQLLRTAWASQYEWKEDKVQNVTLEFRFA